MFRAKPRFCRLLGGQLANKPAASLGGPRCERVGPGQRSRTNGARQAAALGLFSLCPSRSTSFVQPFRPAVADGRASIAGPAIGPC